MAEAYLLLHTFFNLLDGKKELEREKKIGTKICFDYAHIYLFTFRSTKSLSLSSKPLLTHQGWGQIL